MTCYRKISFEKHDKKLKILFSLIIPSLPSRAFYPLTFVFCTLISFVGKHRSTYGLSEGSLRRNRSRTLNKELFSHSGRAKTGTRTKTKNKTKQQQQQQQQRNKKMAKRWFTLAPVFVRPNFVCLPSPTEHFLHRLVPVGQEIRPVARRQ